MVKSNNANRSEIDPWEASWEATRTRQLTLGIHATAVQRLRWLEEMIVIAHKTGALPRASRSLQSRYSLRAATHHDFAFLRALHSLTLKPYVSQLWSWDEAQQESLLLEHFHPSTLKIIQVSAVDIGVLQVEMKPSDVFLGLLLILPDYQNQGLGTQIIASVSEDAARAKLPVTLTVLKPNPAKRLYERLGFSTIGEDSYRYYLKKEPP